MKALFLIFSFFVSFQVQAVDNTVLQQQDRVYYDCMNIIQKHTKYNKRYFPSDFNAHKKAEFFCSDVSNSNGMYTEKPPALVRVAGTTSNQQKNIFSFCFTNIRRDYLGYISQFYWWQGSLDPNFKAMQFCQDLANGETILPDK